MVATVGPARTVVQTCVWATRALAAVVEAGESVGASSGDEEGKSSREGADGTAAAAVENEIARLKAELGISCIFTNITSSLMLYLHFQRMRRAI